MTYTTASKHSVELRQLYLALPSTTKKNKTQKDLISEIALYWQIFINNAKEAGKTIAPWPIFDETSTRYDKISRWFDWVMNIVNLILQILSFYPPFIVPSAIAGAVTGIIGAAKAFIEIMFNVGKYSLLRKGLEGTVSLTSLAFNVAGAVLLKTSGPWSIAYNVISNIDNIMTSTLFFGVYFYNTIMALSGMTKAGWRYLWLPKTLEPTPSETASDTTNPLSSAAQVTKMTFELSPQSQKSLGSSLVMIEENNDEDSIEISETQPLLNSDKTGSTIDLFAVQAPNHTTGYDARP